MGRREHQEIAHDGGHRGRSRWRRDPGWLTWTIGIAVAIVAVIAIPVGLTSMEDRTSPSQKVRLATCGGCAEPDGGAASSSMGAPMSENMGQGASSSLATPSGKASATPKGKATPSGKASPSTGSSVSAPAGGGGGGSTSAPAAPVDEATVYVSISHGLLGGYTADVTIDAYPGYSFPDFTLQFSLPGATSSYTSGVSVHHGSVTVSGGNISSGGSTSFSFDGAGSPDSASGCALSGELCVMENN